MCPVHFVFLQKPDWVNAEMKFTLSADSLSSWDSAIYEDDQEKLSEVPEYIKKLASQGKLTLLLTIHPLLRKLSQILMWQLWPWFSLRLVKTGFFSLLLTCSWACWLWHRKSPWSWFIRSSCRCNKQSGQIACKLNSLFFRISLWKRCVPFNGHSRKTDKYKVLFYSRLPLAFARHASKTLRASRTSLSNSIWERPKITLFSNMYVEQSKTNRTYIPLRWRLNLCSKAQSRNLKSLVNVKVGYVVS